MSKRVHIVFLVVGLSLFIYLIQDVGITNITESLLKMSWWFFPIVAVWGIVYLMNAWAWQLILRETNAKVAFGTVFRLTVSGSALNYVTPFLSLGGEPYRAMALGDTVGMDTSVSSVVQYNIVKALAHFMFWLFGIILLVSTRELPNVILLLLGVLFAVVLTGIVLFFMRNKVYRSSRTGMRLINFLDRKLSKHNISLRTIDQQMTALYKEKRSSFVTAIVLEFMSRVIGSFEYYFIFQSMGLATTISDAIFINAATSLILNILFFIPFELGAREGALYFLMQSISFGTGTGVFVSIANRCREIFWIFIGLTLMTLRGWKKQTAER